MRLGETITFRITNVAGFTHDFRIGPPDELEDMQTTGLPGIPESFSGTQEFTWTVPPDAASLAFGCTIPGHFPLEHGSFRVADGSDTEPESTTVTLTATSTGFVPSTLTVPARTPLTIDFRNTDRDAPHTLAIKGANPDGSDFIGLPIAGPGLNFTYRAPPLEPGRYEFYCPVFADMTGTVIAR